MGTASNLQLRTNQPTIQPAVQSGVLFSGKDYGVGLIRTLHFAILYLQRVKHFYGQVISFKINNQIRIMLKWRRLELFVFINLPYPVLVLCPPSTRLETPQIILTR